MSYGLGDPFVMTTLRYNLDSNGISTASMSDADVLNTWKKLYGAVHDTTVNALTTLPSVFGLSVTTWLLIIGGVLLFKFAKD